MATNKRSIGGAGLEQGGSNLGNSYERENTTPAGGSEIARTNEDAEVNDFETGENDPHTNVPDTDDEEKGE